VHEKKKTTRDFLKLKSHEPKLKIVQNGLNSPQKFSGFFPLNPKNTKVDFPGLLFTGMKHMKDNPRVIVFT